MGEATIFKGSMPSSTQLTKEKINNIFGSSLCQGFILLFFVLVLILSYSLYIFSSICIYFGLFSVFLT